MTCKRCWFCEKRIRKMYTDCYQNSIATFAVEERYQPKTFRNGGRFTGKHISRRIQVKICKIKICLKVRQNGCLCLHFITHNALCSSGHYGLLCGRCHVNFLQSTAIFSHVTGIANEHTGRIATKENCLRCLSWFYLQII